MEQSKLISGIIAKLRIAYPHYFKDFNEEMILGMIKMYHDHLGNYSQDILENSIEEIVVNNKFMPSIAEIIEVCDRKKTIKTFGLLDLMKQDGYFKKGKFGDLDEVQQFRNIEKATMWLKSDTAPEWFKEDMERYEKMLTNKMLENIETKMLEVAHE